LARPHFSGYVFENETITRCTLRTSFYFWGYEFDGIFQNAADATAYMGGTQAAAWFNRDFRIKTFTPNEDGTYTGPDGRIDQNDRTNLGNPFPKLTLGIDLNASFKGFDFNMFISGFYGNDVYNTNIYDLEGMARLFNAGPEVLDRWTAENPSNTIPRAGAVSANLSQSSRYIENGGFTRLRNVTLGYTFPAHSITNYQDKNLVSVRICCVPIQVGCKVRIYTPVQANLMT
jgi:hypothetical protein